MNVFTLIFFALLIWTAPVILIGVTIYVTRRLARLDKRVAQLERTVASTPLAAGPDAPAPRPSPPKPARKTPEPAAAPAVPREPERAPEAAAPPRAPRSAPVTSATAPREPVSPQTSKPAFALEESLGTRLPVWIGSIALALAGAFLVKWSFDNGLLGPAMRIVLGCGFGTALVAAGHFSSRRSRLIASGATAAGIFVLYASILAATSLYGFFSPMLGFLLLAAVTGAAIVLALRHGPIVALLGLVGGFSTPAWIGLSEPSPGILFSYLLLLQSALMFAVRRRNWWLMAPAVLAGGWIWVLAVLFGMIGLASTAWTGMFLLGSLALTTLSVRTKETSAVTLFTGWLAALGAALLAGTMVWTNGFGTMEWAFAGIVAVACILLSRLDERYAGLAAIAPAVTGSMLCMWFFEDGAALESSRYLATLTTLGAASAVASYGAATRSRWPQWFVSVAAATILAFFTLATIAVDPPIASGWTWPGVGLSALLIAAAVPYLLRRDESSAQRQAMSALLIGASAVCALTIPLELGIRWWAAAWAAQLVVTVVANRTLRSDAIAFTAMGLGGLTFVQLFNPFLFTGTTSGSPLTSWLVPGYGIPIAGLLAAAWLLEKRQVPLAVALRAAGVMAFALTLVRLTRFGFSDSFVGSVSLNEAATHSVLLLGLAGALLFAPARWDDVGGRLWRWMSRLTTAAGAAVLALGPALALNPLVNRTSLVGDTPLANGLLYAFALPAAMLGALALTWRARERKVESSLLGTLSLSGLWLWVTLCVRQAFHGSVLAGGATSSAEWYSYSAAWLAFGTCLLIAGIVSRSTTVRYASLVVMLASVLKVFLLDTSSLQDLYRVFSFLGLGASLFLLAFLYQKFVFPRRSSAPRAPASPGP